MSEYPLGLTDIGRCGNNNTWSEECSVPENKTNNNFPVQQILV